MYFNGIQNGGVTFFIQSIYFITDFVKMVMKNNS